MSYQFTQRAGRDGIGAAQYAASVALPRVRWLMIGLCFLATAINYIDRANLAVAAPSIQQELGLSPALMGVILSGFFYTYAIMQLPSGWVADRIGARITYAVAVVWWSLFTAATAAASSFANMLGLRLALGIGEAGAYPCNAKVASLWFPRRERAVASSIFDSGSRVGSTLSLPIVAWLIGSYGWRTSFVVTGALGLVWLVLWLWLYRDPDRHPLVTPEQVAALRAEAGGREAEAAGTHVPWASLFRYRTIWGMMIGFFCLNFVIYFFITWFPTYLEQARHFSLKQMGTMGMLPALISIPGGWLGGIASDWLYRRGWSLTAARKTCLVGGMLVSSVIAFAVLVPTAGEALALLAVSYASLAFTAASIWSLPADIAPTRAHVASIGGIQNFASNIAGILTSTMTGVMLAASGGSFLLPLVIAGGMCVLGALAYLFLVGRIEPLPVRPGGAAA